MPSSYASSNKSRTSNSSTGSSQFSHESANTYSTNITTYSNQRPTAKHFDTCPDRLGLFVEEPLSFDEGIDPRSSVETYASTLASQEDLEDTPEYDLPNERHHVYETDVIPTTAPDFAKLFPTTRRILIQHDDSTSDGNMNLRLDTEAASPDGERLKMTLFHLRMKNLRERQFSLRRYCRDSGREICNSKKKYAKPVPKSLQRKRPSISRSFTTALHNIGAKPKSPSREDSGYETDDDDDNLEEELRKFTLSSEVKATIPTNTIRVEFSNYAQVEVHRHRHDNVKTYDFEYWGAPYTWRREISYDEDEIVYSYELINKSTGKCIAYIMPDKLDGRQARLEEAQGGWVPPSSLRITEKIISEDLGDVIVATGLMALTDDCIKRRWHNSRAARIHIPARSADEYVQPDKVADVVFHRSRNQNSGSRR